MLRMKKMVRLNARKLFPVSVAVLAAVVGACGSDQNASDPDPVKAEKQPFPATGQRLTRCSGTHVAGFDLRVAGGISCTAAKPLVDGFAPHPGETVQLLHGHTCYSQLQPRVGLLVVCIRGQQVFRFNFG